LLAFVAVIFLVIALIHLYLWKRLVRDTLRPGWTRRIGGLAAVVLAVLVPATLIGTRTGAARWLAWPGYLWIALMFYLVVALIVLEVPRLVIGLTTRDRRTANVEPAAVTRTGPPAAQRTATAIADAPGRCRRR
jgi:hypothetical protein